MGQKPSVFPSLFVCAWALECISALYISSKSGSLGYHILPGKPQASVAAAQAVVSFQMNHEGFTSCKTSLESSRV